MLLGCWDQGGAVRGLHPLNFPPRSLVWGFGLAGGLGLTPLPLPGGVQGPRVWCGPKRGKPTPCTPWGGGEQDGLLRGYRNRACTVVQDRGSAAARGGGERGLGPGMAAATGDPRTGLSGCYRGFPYRYRDTGNGHNTSSGYTGTYPDGSYGEP